MVGAVRRRWLTALVVLLLWLVLGEVVASVMPVRYAATAAVTVEPFDTADATARSNADMSTEVQAVAGSAVVGKAAAQLNVTPSQVGDAVTVSNPSGSRVLVISYRADSAQHAASGANAIARAYLAARREQMKAQARAASATVRRRVDALEGLLAHGKLDGTALGSSYAQQLATLQSRLADLTIQGNQTGGRTTTTALPPSSPSGPSHVVYLVGAFILGTACAVAVATLRDRLSPRASDGGQLSERFGVPVITGSPQSSADDVIRTLAMQSGVAQIAAPALVAVVGTTHSSLAHELSSYLQRLGARVDCVDTRLITSRRIDRGWPERGEAGHDVTVVRIEEAVDTALAATIASRCDLVLLQLTRGEALAAADRFHALLGATGHCVHAVTLLHPSHELCTGGRFTPTRVADTAAVHPDPEVAGYEPGKVAR